MSLDQLQKIEGTALLDLRADKLLQQCGLPSDIADTAAGSQPRQMLRWASSEMQLSAMDWEITYSPARKLAHHESAWLNPDAGSTACLSGLAGLVLHAKGDVGILSVKRRADKKGYRTSYDIPKDLYAAHQVTGLSGTWKQAVPLSKIQKQYDKPDEVLNKKGGIKYYRYWVVVRQKDYMPISVHAVDFEVEKAKRVCVKYSVYTVGTNFVQEKSDELLREWEARYED